LTGLAASYMLTTAAASASAAAITAWTDVVVRVYDTSGLPRDSRRRALDGAGAALATASVEITWIDCADAGACRPSPAPRGLIVRLVRGQAATVRRLSPLGHALVDPGTRMGVLATVFADRVQAIAAECGMDEATLLGRAIAHEVGHLLAGSNTHARAGLMRAFWTPEELRRDRPEDLGVHQRLPADQGRPVAAA
jgi:hypothetical protein